jgi:hypothetical protein
VLDTLLAQPTVVEVYRLNLGDAGSVGGTVVNGTLVVQTNGSSYTCSGGQIAPLLRVVDEGGGGPPVAHQPGDVVISEYLQNPAAVADAAGEWIELRNTTSAPIDLLGFRVRDQGTDQFVLPSLVVPAYGHVTLAAFGDPAQNGGHAPSYVWPAGTMFLGNNDDEIEVVSPTGGVLDAVAYGAGTGFPAFAGKSVERKDATAPPWAANFASATTPFGAGDWGTPGAPNAADHTPPFATLLAGGPLHPGGSVVLTLAAAGTAGLTYVMVLSHSNAPAIVLPADGRAIDLAPGWLLDFSLMPGNGVTSGFAGAMNGVGLGFGTLSLPPEPGLAGISFHAGGVVLDGAYPGGIGSIAPSIPITIQ